MGIFGLLMALAFLFAGGVVFALPVYLPSVRKRARQSQGFRVATMMSLSTITFLTFFLGIMYIGAMVTVTFASVIACTLGGDYCIPVVQIDETIENQVIRELWMQSVVPPLATDAPCFNSNPDVCAASSEIRVYDDYSLASYLMSVLLMLIPAVSCGIVTHQLTKSVIEPRKKKKRGEDVIIVD